MKIKKILNLFSIKEAYKRIAGGRGVADYVIDARGFILQQKQELIKQCMRVREKLQDIPNTNYKLGLYHLRAGNLSDAVMRFKMVTHFTPNRAEAHYNLGKALILQGEVDEGEEALRQAIKLQSDFPEVDYLMNKINNIPKIKHIPASIIAEHTEYRNNRSDDDNKDLSKSKLLISTLLLHVEDKNPNLDVLELGVSQGNNGVLLRNKEVIKSIVGVDISAQLVSNVSELRNDNDLIYNDCKCKEISDYIHKNKKKFDVILAGNVFSYTGDLTNIFLNMRSSLKKKGILAFIVKIDEIYEGFKLDITQDRFLHSIDYFTDCLHGAKMNLIDKKEKNIAGDEYCIFIANV